MDEFDPIALTDLVGRIYEAAADDRHWNEFVDVLSQLYPAARIAMFGHDHKNPALSLKLSHNFPADDLKAYFDHHIKTSPYIARAGQLTVGQAAYSETLIRDDELHRTEHFNEFVRPRGLGHYSAGILLERSAGRTLSLSIVEHEDDAAVRARQFRLIEILGPHLMRALQMRRGLAAMKAETEATQAAFDRWTHAAMVLNAEGGVVSINAAAERLLRRADGISLGRDGTLRCIDHARTRRLGDAIRKCGAVAGMVDADAALPELDGIEIPRPSGDAPLRAMIWPLPFLSGGLLDERPGAVLLVLFDPGQVTTTRAGWMARQFGLTPSEQKLTEALINGLPLAEAAEQLGIRLNTARTRLKTIQAKTGCRRQADLVRLAMSAPPIDPRV